MAKSKVRPNQRGIEEFLRGPEFQQEMRRRGEQVVDAGQRSAPVLTGEYRDSIHLIEEMVDGKAAVRIIADTDHSIFVEAETGNLTRALDAAGGVF